jgi:sulfide:quinone oxidoreductase
MAGFSVVICGGGIAGIEGLLRLRKLAGDGVDVTLLSPQDELVYRPMTVREPFAAGRARRYPIRRVAADTNARWLCDSLGWVDRERRVVHTSAGQPLPYDALLLALGGRERAPMPNTEVFTGRDDGQAYRSTLEGIQDGHIASVAYVQPAGPTWPLPLFELALLTAKHARSSGRRPKLTVVIPTARPMEAFGREAGITVARLLDAAGIALHTAASVRIPGPRHLVLQPGDVTLRPDRIVTLPVITGPNVRGIPGRSLDRFLPIDTYCRVLDVGGRIFAAGDATDLAVKHGGVGAQQADTAAAGIAHLAGLAGAPTPLYRQIRATFLTGGEPLYVSAHLIAGQGWQAVMHDQPPWPAEDKVIAEELGPYLRGIDAAAP